ncbi:PAS domain-containing protein [Haloterrigena sp. SYSU A558-1]|uniref:histidine kinase n=1 Tax=Haloterrigena gelatinilytica TaxID=2741724 RepID=A0A8J8KG31_9EURY|nr:ATP-binding protein [Haloterrigena gelatinilytica]NUB89579.1 PAS domain-containing protein [Haloterrigena gelatinilytica]NUC74591.1 PAS domain-containing protein [Haloterrigena gelatinilytica]
MTDPETSSNPSNQSSPEAVLERVTDAVFELNDDWQFTYCNDQAATLFERDQTELCGKIIWEEFSELTNSTFQWEHERAMETQEAITFETHYPPQDGWFEVRIYPTETGLSVYVRDIADPDNRQQELEKREHALRRANEVMAAPDRPFSQQIAALLEIVRTTVGTEFATLSQVKEDTGEYIFEHVAAPEEVDLEPGDTTPLETLPNCSRVVETEETLVLQDVKAEAPELADPEWGIACYLGTPVIVHGEVYGTFCFYGMEAQTEAFSDWEVSFIGLLSNWVSNELEYKVYEQELEESNERLEQFAYAASHDLQEPLRMVTSYLQLVESRYANDLDEDGREFIEFAVDGATRMRDMIDGLLEYSRVDTRGDPLDPVELDTVLEDVRADLQLKIEETNAEIVTETLPTVEGDANQLREVFQNLLDNAIEYSGSESPRVYVSSERTGDEWTISVRDDGVGIDSADTDRVFNVFQSLHTQEEGGGTGIGLALCERIIKRHGGDIWVESDPHEGTTFSFTLLAADKSDN